MLPVPQNKLRFGRYDIAGFSAFTMYAFVSLAIPLMIVKIGDSLHFPLDKGGMGAGGILHAVRSTAMIGALLCCGAVAARLGKRVSMGLCMILCGAGILSCAFSQAYWMLLPCLLVAGIGEGICEGILTPFIQDLHTDEPERYVSFAHSFWSVGIGAAVVAVGGLLTLGVDWRIILGITGAATAAVSLLFLWRENPQKKYPERSEKQNLSVLWRCTGQIAREPRFWVCGAAMFFGSGAEFGLTFWSAAYIELTFRTGAWVAGLGTGAIALGMFVGRAGFGYIARPERLRWILLGTGLGTIPVTLALAVLKPGSMPAPLLFTLLFSLLALAGIGIAAYWPMTQVHGVTSLPHCDSTLLYVYYSTLGIPGAGFFAWLMGAAGDRFGLSGTIAVAPVCMLIFSALIVYECWINPPPAFSSREEKAGQREAE